MFPKIANENFSFRFFICVCKKKRCIFLLLQRNECYRCALSFFFIYNVDCNCMCCVYFFIWPFVVCVCVLWLFVCFVCRQLLQIVADEKQNVRAAHCFKSEIYFKGRAKVFSVLFLVRFLYLVFFLVKKLTLLSLCTRTDIA